MKSKILSSIVISFLMLSASAFGNENYSRNFQEQLNISDNNENKYVCDDLHEAKRVVEGKNCLEALDKYNKERKSEGKPWCSVRRLHKNKDGCYCFPRMAKGQELTNMCQKKDFYKNDHPSYQIGGM